MSPLATAGLRLHRTGTGPPVVLLHCLGVDHHLWDWLTPDLIDRWSVLTYDLPGHGEAAVPTAPYTIADLSSQLSDLLESAGVDRAHVVGISLGGLIAQHFAATQPRRVDTLLLVDTTPRYVDALRCMWVDRAATARTHGVAALTDGLLDIWFTPELVSTNPPPVQYVRACFARTSGEGYALACEALAAADLESLVPSIEAATLVVCGDQDIPSFRSAAEWLATTIPRARLAWLSPARHASLLEQPAAFAALMQEMFSR